MKDLRIKVNAIGSFHRPSQGGRRLFVKQNAGSQTRGVQHRFQRTPTRVCNNGLAACHRLNGDNAEIFLTRKNDIAAACEVITDNGIRLPPQKLNRRARHRPQPGQIGAIPDDHQPSVQMCERLHSQINPLVRN